jgi:DNA-binding CsgD family transcriptional regulator
MKEKTRKIEFTERELKTIEMLASGYNDPEIAEYFKISIHTIRNILTQLYRKTNTVNRTQLVAWAFRAKLVD